MVASFSPRSQSASDSSRVVPPASRARTTSISSSRAASYDGFAASSRAIGQLLGSGGGGMEAAVGDTDADLGAGREAGHGGEDVTVGVLQDGVPAAQRLERRQRPGPGPLVTDVVVGAVELVGERAPGPVAQHGDLTDALREERPWVGEGRAGAQGVETGL